MTIPSTSNRDIYPSWVFDDSPIDDPFGYGERAVKFLRLLHHPKSTLPGRPFTLDPWLERIVRRIYGPRHPDGTRIIKTVVLLLGRGNRKTSISAALGLLHAIGPERIPGGQCLLAAYDRTQAGYGFAEACGIVREDKRLSDAVRIYDAHNSVKKLILKTGSSYLEALSSDGGTAHGRTPAFVFCDELHRWGKKGKELWEALKSGMPKTRGSLMIVATTAGRGQDDIAFETVDRARKVATGEIDDPSWLPILFETPADADWRDEAVWYRANPGLALSYQDIDGFRQLAKEAETSITARETFRNYNLNIWLDRSTSPFVDMAIYDKGDRPIPDDIDGLPCWIGVDCSSTTDLTAVVACIPYGDDYLIIPSFFCPAENLRSRSERDGAPYVTWAEQGYITPTPGTAVDYRAVESCIRNLCKRFDVQEIDFDAALAQPVMGPLLDDAFPVVEISQQWRTQTPALNALEKVIIEDHFVHAGNPILRWNFANIALHRWGNDNRAFRKDKSTGRIDGAVASWMAVSRAVTGERHGNFLDNPAITADMLVW
ncbi:MAG: terminase large subunit [Rhizobiales bacterium]|nr:terminase large subunit [Hyphomicrobiales bacterium]